MMTQPEYVLLNGANASSSTNTSEQRLLDTAAGKIIFIELYG